MARDFTQSVLISDSELLDLLKAIPEGNAIEGGDFFARFALSNLLQSGNYYQAFDRGGAILHQVRRLAPDIFEWIHKGAPFYWMGISAYAMQDFQTAIYYIDAAVSEDIKNVPNPDSPARLFLRLETKNKNQAAFLIVQGATNSIEEYISFYNDVLTVNKLGLKPLSIEIIKSSLLVPASLNDDPSIRSMASSLISFFLEFKYRDFQLRLRTYPGTNEPFSMHLIKGCLLFESLLKNNLKQPVNGSTLNPVLKGLSTIPGFPKKVDTHSPDLLSVLAEVLKPDDNIELAINNVGKLRNTLMHNLGWPTEITADHYTNGFLLIAVSCLHTINTLYRK